MRNKKFMKPIVAINTPGIINDRAQSVCSKLLAIKAPIILPTDVWEFHSPNIKPENRINYH